MILLNLTIPPLLIIYLGASVLSNLSLPAPPMSQVAAFWLNGTPIPSWVVGNRLYVLQLGQPAYVEYVPQYYNSTGLYELALNATAGAVIMAPPGIIVDVEPENYSVIAINRSGLFIYIKAPRVKLNFSLIAIVTTSTTTKGSVVAPPPTTSQQSVTSSTTRGGNAASLIPYAVGLVVVAAILSLLLLRRRRDCVGLGETDLKILRALQDGGGRVKRSELGQRLGLPASTLHKHLHKLSRMGYVRLVTEQDGQRVELVKKC
ncbi:helix-turn-helix transcriptional regulator [Thermoproteus tenax]|uniref:helix-turn-helix transcriptional regulator n=1 Tax=Thermoproteus tenax TaxID=2271 RepID=UPI00069B53A5|nr:winged helix-turn-helix transcriptional regulator [Thermoproteus tenax]